MSYFKAFDSWNLAKQSIEVRSYSSPHIDVGEVRWASFGVNVGSEIDGKGEFFVRPCLILSVIGSKRAIVLPITSKIKTDEGYMSIEVAGRTDTLCINQIRSISQKRIYRRIGKISKVRLIEIRKEVGAYLEIV